MQGCGFEPLHALLHKFYENTMCAGRVEKGDSCAAGAGPRYLFDEAETGRPSPRHRGLHVRNKKCQMVNTLAAGSQKPPQSAPWIKRLDELELRVPRAGKRNPYAFLSQDLPIARNESKKVAKRVRSGLQVVNDQCDVRQADLARGRAHRIPVSRKIPGETLYFLGMAKDRTPFSNLFLMSANFSSEVPPCPLLVLTEGVLACQPYYPFWNKRTARRVTLPVPLVRLSGTKNWADLPGGRSPGSKTEILAGMYFARKRQDHFHYVGVMFTTDVSRIARHVRKVIFDTLISTGRAPSVGGIMGAVGVSRPAVLSASVSTGTGL